MKTKRIIKFFVMILVVAFTLSIVACKKKNDTPTTPDTPVTPDTPEVPDTPVVDGKIVVPSDLADLSVRSVTASNGVAAAANPFAAFAGKYVLEQGGNAFDAAVAIAFTLGVVEPNASGIGGGGIMVAYDADRGDFVGYNFREFVPAMAKGSNSSGMTGDAGKLPGALKAAGVPTEVAGLVRIQAERGSGNLTLAEVMKPAIQFASEGFEVTAGLAAQLRDNQTLASKANYEQFWDIFSNDGIETVKEGETLIQADYGRTLKKIAEEGVDAFYTGSVAEAIVAANGPDKGGFITLDDLLYARDNYPVTFDPIQVNYHGYTVLSSNVPSSGGIILCEALNMLDSYFGNTGLRELGHNSPEYINAVETALWLGYGDKKKFIADYNNDKNLKDYRAAFTSRKYAQQRYNAAYRPGQAIADYYVSNYYGDPATFLADNAATEFTWEQDDAPTGTTAFSVADKDGNIVSVTQTINHFFGNGIMPTGCGFYMNNNLTSFSLSASSVHYVRAYKQPVSHIMPTIILDAEGNPFATLGSPGSMRLVAAVTETILNLIDFDMGMQEAINAPRFYAYPDQNHAYVQLEETGDITPETVAALEAMGYWTAIDDVRYKAVNLYFGGVQGIKFNADGTMTGGADPRRDGKAVGY